MKVFCVRNHKFEQMLSNVQITTPVYDYRRGTHTKSDTQGLISKFSDEKPDFFYFLKDEQLTPNLLKTLKDVSPKTKFVMTYQDQRGEIPPLILERKGLIDILLINNEDPAQFRMYKQFGIPHTFTFHHGVPVDEFLDFPLPVTHDVFFGGNNFKGNRFPLSKFRYTFINRVHELFNLVVYGDGWLFPTKKRVPRPQYARVLRTANINLGINHYDVIGYYDRRIFECMGSGRVHITKYVRGMEKHFENGKHLIWFNTFKEGFNAIQNMLKYPEKREAIAAAGRKLVFEQHNFSVRVDQFKKILEAI